ncbi:hypothetical protein DFJ74DRAFT_734806 [Hyaloraphidium curvatum]|nr:hypothetical protein DFJ74DRAFT_734806 [Hyaloraphidium curvatum]
MDSARTDATAGHDAPPPHFTVDPAGRPARYVFRRIDPTIPREPPPPGDAPPLLARDPALKLAAADPGVPLNIARTLRHMALRRIIRRRNGEFAPPSRLAHLAWTAIFAVLAVVFIAAGVYHIVTHSRGDPNSPGLTLDQWFLFFILIVLVPRLFLGPQTRQLTRSVFLVADAWCVGIFLLDIFIKVQYEAEKPSGQPYDQDPYWRSVFIGLTVAAVAIITLLIARDLWHLQVLPWLLATGRVSDERTVPYFDLRPVEDRPWTFSFKPEGSFRRSTLTYRGSVDADGRPDGYGEYLDDSTGGESLSGFFRNGIPVAPFTSAIPTTGSTFSAARIAILRNCASPWDTGSLTLKRSEGLTVGVAAVECCLAGRFLRHLPEATLLMPPERVSPESTAKMLKLIAEPPESDPGLDAAVLYVHGLFNTARVAAAEISQVRALGAYPAGLKFFVFDWPAGRFPISTFYGVRKVSKSQGVKEDLWAAVRYISSLGFKTLHVVGHSMGCRVSCHLTERASELFLPRGAERSGPDDPRMRLATVTLIHGEMDLVDFVSVKYPVLRAYAGVVTCYTDPTDKALELAEFLTGRLAMGRNPDGFFLTPGDPACGEEFAGLMEREPGWLKARTGSDHDLAGKLGAAVGIAAGAVGELGIEIAEAVPVPADATEVRFRRNVDARGPIMVREPVVKGWLDLDVVDSSFLDTNTDKARHSLFIFNRTLLDDVYEVVTTGRRAAERTSRLLRRGGNVFVYLVAPSFVAAL